MNKPLLTIIIPAYNEEISIRNTLVSLYNQVDSLEKPIDKNLYQLIIVDNNSTDKTVEIVNQFSEQHKDLNILLTKERQQGITQARISGYNFSLANESTTTLYYASGDADTLFNKYWVQTILKTFKDSSADVISNAGCFPHDFWVRVPNLVDKYIDDVGTIFFNPETVEWVKHKRKSFLFTEQIFIDFNRPVTDGCFAISRNAYLKAGGYTLEFWDKKCLVPVHGESWRLVFKLERMNAKIVYSNKAPYNYSPRRLLSEPEKFLKTTSYSKEKPIVNIRSVKGDLYARLNEYALEVDLKPIQKYIIDYYIFLKCITIPELLIKNRHYFGKSADKIYTRINEWWRNKIEFEGKELFEFSNELGNDYFEEMMKTIPRVSLV